MQNGQLKMAQFVMRIYMNIGYKQISYLNIQVESMAKNQINKNINQIDRNKKWFI